MHQRTTRRGAIAALAALAAFAGASLVAPSNAAAQLSKGLNADILLLKPGASLLLLTEPIPGGAGADNGDNFNGGLSGFNLPTSAPNFAKIHDFTSFRLTAPLACKNCLADVQNSIRNDGTLYVALAPAGYCATQFPTEGSPVILRIPAAELQTSRGLTGTVFTWSGRPIALPLLDGPATMLALAKAPAAPTVRQPRFLNVRLTISGGPVVGVLASLGIPAETGELDVDGDADLTALLAGAPGVKPDAVFPSGPSSSVSTDVVVALATGVAASDDISAPSDPGLPLGLVASCETLNAPITSENPPGL